ncbi:hypothetical protein GW17_00055374 [Ensete ventricosum]|nr:hypothetical protein GW17_00055374 [Ensete ventricosum]
MTTSLVANRPLLISSSTDTNRFDIEPPHVTLHQQWRGRGPLLPRPDAHLAQFDNGDGVFVLDFLAIGTNHSHLLLASCYTYSLLCLPPSACSLLFGENYTSRLLPSSHIFLGDYNDHGPHTRSFAGSHPANSSFYRAKSLLVGPPSSRTSPAVVVAITHCNMVLHPPPSAIFSATKLDLSRSHLLPPDLHQNLPSAPSVSGAALSDLLCHSIFNVTGYCWPLLD